MAATFACRRSFTVESIAFAGLILICATSAISAAGPAQPPTRWWKGNIHTHSLWSDGNDFPEMIADWYVKHGYNFLALTDHNVLSKGERWKKHDEIVKKGYTDALEKYIARFGEEWVETRGTAGMPDYEVRLRPLDEFRKLVETPGEFIMVQSEEISDKAQNVPIHMNVANIQEVLDPAGGKTVAETIENNLRAAEAQSKRLGKEMLIHLNHPNFGYAITAEEIASVIHERFVEVYNGHPGVNHQGDKYHASVEQIWDIANTLRIAKFHAPPLYGVATDDSHTYNGSKGARPGRGWIMVPAADLEPESLIRSIKAGNHYASSGVTLHDVRYDRAKKLLQVAIDAKPGVTYKTQFIGTEIGYDPKSKPRLDKDGKPFRTTRKYSHDVGKVFATVEGPTHSYQLTGKELYVRAVVNSSEAPDDPAFEDQHQQAWTQPVGWEEHIRAAGKSPTESAGGE